jgi:flavin-dependent dehydrogenase
MEVNYDLVVVGGGPAGCAAAITAANQGRRVLLLEKGRYPRHRVCGEFISPESHQTLSRLLGDGHPLVSQPAQINSARMFVDGKCLQFFLPECGWSISRFDLDQALWRRALDTRIDARQNVTVRKLTSHTVDLGSDQVSAGVIINATGRWSNLRRTVPASSQPRWIGLKAHFAGERAPRSTDIYFFEGGYCGVQPIDKATVNASAMVRADKATSLEEVFAAHPQLWFRSRAWEQVAQTVTTSPLFHADPEPVTEDIMNAGDAAAFIDPFTGDGISLALHSGVLAAECAFNGGSNEYAREYKKRFSRAFQTAAITRRLSRAPLSVRQVAALAFRSKSIKRWALLRTRAH